MYKTRELSLDLGITGTSNYYASSGVTYDSKIALDPELQAYLGAGITNRFLEGSTMATSNVVIPNYYGAEVFESSEKRRPAFNTCRHLKDQFVSHPYAYMAERYNRATTKYYAKFQRFGKWNGSTPKVLTNASFGDYESASRRAWWSMKPRFEGEVSMLNFLFELKDFRDIAKALSKNRSPGKLANTMRHFRTRLRKIDKKMCQSDAPLSVVAKNTAGAGIGAAKLSAQARLINEFALKPLISDCGKILAQAGEIVNDVQRQFKDQGEELNTSHYSEENEISSSLTPGTYNSYWWAYGSLEKQRFTATHEYRYSYTMRKESEAFKRYWGLNMTPEVIWNATPFSFLVDYFAKVGQAIHFMTGDPNVKLFSSQYCESILQDYQSGYITTGDPRANLTINGRYPIVGGELLTGHTSSLYQRKVCSPNKGAALPRLRLPNSNQGKNMAALAICFIK